MEYLSLVFFKLLTLANIDDPEAFSRIENTARELQRAARRAAWEHERASTESTQEADHCRELVKALEQVLAAIMLLIIILRGHAEGGTQGN